MQGTTIPLFPSPTPRFFQIWSKIQLQGVPSIKSPTSPRFSFQFNHHNFVSTADLLEGTFGKTLKGEEAVLAKLDELMAMIGGNENGAEIANNIIAFKPNILGVEVNTGEIYYQLRKWLKKTK